VDQAQRDVKCSIKMPAGLTRADEFPWLDLDTKRWPGRELLWVWCHPFVSAVIVIDSLLIACLIAADR
jgi:hypothetical protein